MSSTPRPWWPLPCAALLIALAFFMGWQTTHDLQWPNEHDLYRELASAQSLLSEGFGKDPEYAGETTWYNPLTHLVVAAIYEITGVPLPRLVAQAGTYVNLLGPVTFFLMAGVLFGLRTALYSLAGYLFCVYTPLPSWAGATYSPWLYPGVFTQAFFYLAIILAWSLRDRIPGVRWSVAAGLLLGVLFMGHTAPALLIVLTVLAHHGPRLHAALREAPSAWPRVLLAGVVAVLAFVIASYPFLTSIIGHYRLHIENPIPGGYVADMLGLRQVPAMIALQLSPASLIAWFGLYQLTRRKGDATEGRLLTCWVLLAAALVGYGYVCVVLSKFGIALPTVVPSFHFLFYLKAGISLLFGVGVSALADTLSRLLAQMFPRRATPGPATAGLVLVAALALWSFPDYVDRYDFDEARGEALLHAAEGDRIVLYDWVRENGSPTDVFAASDELSLFAISPAGSKVLALNPYFSNPYVSWEQRDADRRELFHALHNDDARTFDDLVARYGVTHVVVDHANDRVTPPQVGRHLKPVFEHGSLRVYLVAASNRDG